VPICGERSSEVVHLWGGYNGLDESWVPEGVPKNILDRRLACMPRITPSAQWIRTAGLLPQEQTHRRPSHTILR